MSKIYVVEGLNDHESYSHSSVRLICEDKEFAEKACEVYQEMGDFNNEGETYEVQEYEITDNSPLELCKVITVRARLWEKDRHINFYNTVKKEFKHSNKEFENFAIDTQKNSNCICEYIIQTIINKNENHENLIENLQIEAKNKLIEKYSKYAEENKLTNILNVSQEYFDLKENMLSINRKIFDIIIDKYGWEEQHEVFDKYKLVYVNHESFIKNLSSIKEKYLGNLEIINLCNEMCKIREIFDNKHKDIKFY